MINFVNFSCVADCWLAKKFPAPISIWRIVGK